MNGNETMKNPIIEDIERYNRDLNRTDLLTPVADDLCNFMRTWHALYCEYYFVCGLDQTRKGKTWHVDLKSLSDGIFRKAMKQWVEQMTGHGRRTEATLVESIYQDFTPSAMPCMIEQTEAFKKELGLYLERKQNAASASVSTLQKEFTQKISHMGLHMTYGLPLKEESWFSAVTTEAQTRVTLDHIPLTYNPYKVPLMGREQTLWVPQLTPWQSKWGCPHFNATSIDSNQEVIRQLLLTLLLAFPTGKLKVSFIDLGFSTGLTNLRSCLDEAYLGDLVLTADELTAWTRSKTQYLRDTFAQYGDVVARNTKMGRMEHGYELCIIHGVASDTCPAICMEQLTKLMADGTNAGIYFLFIGTLPTKWPANRFLELPRTPQGAVCKIIPTLSDELTRKLFSLLTNQVSLHERKQEEQKQQQLKHQQKQLFEADALDASLEFSIEIGTDSDTEQRVNFTLDEEHHVHAFVLGQTGSGKSVFLHTLLGNAMLKYSPKSLQFYLMDFKTGGVELNRYHQYPHVRALLVDESDPHITLEILRDITTLMQERGELMRNAGCNNLKSYNAAHPAQPLPRIVLLVDECHELFREGRHKIQTEMDDIVTRIAKQGRSQGVHIIFATQTLTGCTLPRDIIGQITDPYLLKCDPVDALRFVEGAQGIVNQLKPHCVVHFNKQTEQQECFLPDFIEPLMDQYLEAILHKNQGAKLDFTPFYFTGTQKYSLEEGLSELTYRRHPELSLGKSLEVRSHNVSIRLRNDLAQNLLILGANDRFQSLRVALVSLLSLMHYSEQTGVDARFILFLNDDLIDYPDLEDYVYALAKRGVEICDNQRKRLTRVEELYTLLKADNNRPTFVIVTNQDGYVELRQNAEVTLSTQSSASSSEEDAQQRQTESNLFFGGDLSFTAQSHAAAVGKIPLRSVWKELLINGPECNIYTVWQLQKLSNLFFDNGSIYASEVFKHFLYLALLRNDRDTGAKFNFDDIHLEELGDDPERLRLYLYNAMTNSGVTLSPYVI